MERDIREASGRAKNDFDTALDRVAAHTGSIAMGTPQIAEDKPKPNLENRLAYKTTELTQVLPFGKTKIFAMLKSGELKSVKVGKTRLVSAKTIREMLGQ